MLRAVISAWSALALTGTSAAEEITIVTRSHNGHSYAEIIQTGPRDDKPVIETRRGPGYVIVEQRNKHNRALIIQGGARGDE